jgi:hypothetical protein
VTSFAAPKNDNFIIFNFYEYGYILTHIQPYTKYEYSDTMIPSMAHKIEDLTRDVEIIEPPIQELKKRGPWFTTACLSGCGCVLIFVVALIIGIKIYIGAGPKEIKNLPAHFPIEIPVYDQYNIEKITVVSGQYKSRSMDLAAFFPKILLSPIIYPDNSEPNAPSKTNKSDVIKEIWKLLVKPTADDRDTIIIEWHDITSEPQTMIQYYQTKLKDAGFIIESETVGHNYKQFLFKRDNDFSVNLYVEYSEKAQKIPHAFIVVNIPGGNSLEQESDNNNAKK